MSELTAQESQVSGQAQVIKAGNAVLRAVIEVKRAATGNVEIYEITGTLPNEEPKEAE